ncbi:class I SAM-dependent methyltransferase [Hymenobacter monticola]|uniref:Class I SAM-dependent methyltransferase n=1 Tax=Hymenobacter monticola TaxID=1705399 RepID=A0ABY4B3R5_9BACT|nr:class I SAM-dependent methyltransferase [Hymenobacter monticola]UOE33489.1 class I SAM-dependent methyltransferase [Hymenobacter monticola]
MPAAEIATELVRLEQNPAIREELNFAARADALDYLEFHLIDRLASLGTDIGPAAGVGLLQQRAERLQQQLEAIDAALFQRLRVEIRAGYHRGAAFRALAEQCVGFPIASRRLHAPAAGYDVLDEFTNGLFQLRALPLETTAREPEMVHYQKTPTRIVFELVEQAAFAKEDVFVDVGAGLGHVPLLLSLLSGVRARGIELEPAYVAIAAGWAADLGLSRVTFKQADARWANYSEGTVFFLYTPFGGRMMAEVMERLRAESQRRRITLFTYGPCTLEVARQPWLQGVGAGEMNADRLAQFKS